ncbi:Ger(x)C family spore germination protein [Shouchella shacheensis]|uniref:Ger(x)C family spore germination protein n=1 Tax=Shouchella shacheensis TaxID=1649580 RepID=UPI0007401477|nr:Ger(x)C family spore germination protein [Shouchella shacheensis]
MSHKWSFLFILLACLAWLSGCWSSEELTDLAIVSALALDKNEDGQYVGTYQVINAANIPGALQGGAGGQSPSVTVYTATGDNQIEMLSRLTARISRKPYFAHTNLLIISEKLAEEEDISITLDAMERGLEFRAASTAVIARDIKAEDLAKVLTWVDQIPAEKIAKALEFIEQTNGSNIKTNIQEVIKSDTSTGKEPLIGGFSMIGDAEKGIEMGNLQSTDLDANPEASGIAVFKEGKLVNWLDSEKARGSMWVLNRIQSTPVNIEWENEEEAVAYQVIREKTNVSAQIKAGKPTILVEVRAEGDVRSLKVPVEVTNPHVLLDMEKVVEAEIKEEIEAAVQEAQENKADVFGFGDKMHQSYPKVWKTLESDWHDVSFPELDVEVKVEAFIRRTGMRNNPSFND